MVVRIARGNHSSEREQSGDNSSAATEWGGCLQEQQSSGVRGSQPCSLKTSRLELGMIRFVRVVAVAALVIFPVGVQAALVDAGELTSVYTFAPLFDARNGSDNGCDPAGCLGELSRVRIQLSFSTSGRARYNYSHLPSSRYRVLLGEIFEVVWTLCPKPHKVLCYLQKMTDVTRINIA